MSFESALRRRLKACPSVVATKTSVEWVKRPQGSPYPAVVMQIVSAGREQIMKGWQIRWARVEISAMAETAPGKVALREALIAAFAGPATVEGTVFMRVTDVRFRDRSEQTDTKFIHRDLIEALFWYREAA